MEHQKADPDQPGVPDLHQKQDRTISTAVLIVTLSALIVGYISFLSWLPGSPIEPASISPERGATYLGVIATVGITMVGVLWARGPDPHPVSDQLLHYVSVVLTGLALLAALVGVAVLVDHMPDRLSLDQLVVSGASGLFVVVALVGESTIPTQVSLDHQSRAKDKRREHIDQSLSALGVESLKSPRAVITLVLPWAAPALVEGFWGGGSRVPTVALAGALFLVITATLVVLFVQHVQHAWLWMLPTFSGSVVLASLFLLALVYLPADSGATSSLAWAVALAVWLLMVALGCTEQGGLRASAGLLLRRAERKLRAADTSQGEAKRLSLGPVRRRFRVLTGREAPDAPCSSGGADLTPPRHDDARRPPQPP